MKNITFFTSLLLSVILLPSCKETETFPDRTATIDSTTYCMPQDESARYSTFFKPVKGWFGDPFPYYDNGKFYIHYLQDWRGIQPYLHPFHMVTTTDISTFDYQGEVLPVGSSAAQDASLCTGSIIKNKDNGLYYMFYAGHKFNNDPATPVQAVLVAVSRDMKQWTKDETFYLSISGDGYNRDDFRDPFVYYDENTRDYKMLVTTRRNGKGVLACLSSRDLYHWSLKDPFYEDESGAVLECADVFKEGDYWYLIYSNVQDRRVHYKYSTSRNGPWSTPNNPTLDGVAFYAGKTASDGNNRYLFGWCPTRIGDGAEDQWGGSLVTHQLVSQPDGTLAVMVPKGIEDKFKKEITPAPIKQTGEVQKNSSDFLLKAKSEVLFPRITAPIKITTQIKASGLTDTFGFVFGACDDESSHYYIKFDLEKKKLSMYQIKDAAEVVQTENNLSFDSALTFDVKVVIENSVCVTYVNDQIAFTNRIGKLTNNPWKIFSSRGLVTYNKVAFYEE